MADRLPSGWVHTTLGAIARPGRPRVSPDDHPDLPYVGLEHVESDTMRLLSVGRADEIKSSSILFDRGDVLYAKLRPYLNKVWVAEFQGLCSAEFLVFPRIDELDSTFLALRLNSRVFVSFANQRTSGERPRVDFNLLKSFPVKLPPLNEQRRIASKLQDSFKRLQASEVAALRASERLVRYRHALVSAAVSGELTRNWRAVHGPDNPGDVLLQRVLHSRHHHWERAQSKRVAESPRQRSKVKQKTRYKEAVEVVAVSNLPQLPGGWAWASLDQLTISIRNGISTVPNETKGLPILRISSVRPMSVDLTERRYLPSSLRDTLTEFVLNEGDLLFTRYNGSRDLAGVCGRVPKTRESIVYPDKLIRCVVVPNYSPMDRFIEMAVNFGASREKIAENLRTTAGQWGLSGADLKTTPIPFPPPNEQKQIVKQVRSRLSAAGRLERTLESQIRQIRNTRQSLLQAGLDGKLLPQDPVEEPASTLLEQISLARNEYDKKQKGRHMNKSRKATLRQPLREVLNAQKKAITPEQLYREAGFRPGEAALFYRELSSLREFLIEVKPVAMKARRWPTGSRVLLRLKK